MSDRCFYCDRPYHKAPSTRQRWNARHDPLFPTDDHVYPSNTRHYPSVLLTNALDTLAVGREHPRNKVRCCLGCNHTKGNQQPTTWLTKLRNNAGAMRLSALLLELGEDPIRVNDALTKRLASQQ